MGTIVLGRIFLGLLQVAIHVVQNPPRWRAKFARGQGKKRKLPLKFLYVFCLSSPGATFALQNGGFVPREWLGVKGLLQTPGPPGWGLGDGLMSHRH